jgi:Domain of Unknown Function (DUF1080)
MRILLILALTLSCAAAADKSPKKPKKDDWQPIFNGTTLDGWKAGDNSQSWTVKDGAIRGDGPRSHLFYMTTPCVNCEFKAEVRLNHGGNSGMYMRATFGPGFPKGYEAQVENTSSDPVKTGSLYNFVKIFEQLIPDDTWCTQHVIIDGNHIQIFVNDKATVDFIDEKNTHTSGFLALQQHNAGSVVEYKNLMMKVLPAPKTPLAGTWNLKEDQSTFSAGDIPKHLELRILEERDGVRYQSERPGPDKKPIGANYFARLDGYDYVLAGSPDYDHISIEQIDEHKVHEALKIAKIRKKTDEHYFLSIQRRGFVEVGRATYTLSADGKTLRREGNLKHDNGDELKYVEVFEKAEP